jgi:hypothetical protein
MQKVLQLYVYLLESEPVIWRRVLLSPTTRLPRLHTVLQAVMGWENYHLHEFRSGFERFGPPDADDGYDARLQDETTVNVGRFLKEPGDSLTYEYDLGDSWLHAVVFETWHAPVPGRLYPVCTGGAQACPPEDAGGLHGYYHYLSVIADPTHEEYEELIGWRGGGFDPNRFDLARVNAALKPKGRGPGPKPV